MVLDSNQVCGIVDLADEIVSINSINQDSLNQDPTSNIYTNNINLNTSTKHEPSSNEQISNNQIKAKLKELNIGSHLSSKQQRELFKVIIKHKNAFAWNDNEIGRTNLIKHSIKTTSDQPIKKAPYRVAPAQREIINNLIGQLQSLDLVEESSSPWAAPVVLVKKKEKESVIQ